MVIAIIFNCLDDGRPAITRITYVRATHPISVAMPQCTARKASARVVSRRRAGHREGTGAPLCAVSAIHWAWGWLRRNRYRKAARVRRG